MMGFNKKASLCLAINSACLLLWNTHAFQSVISRHNHRPSYHNHKSADGEAGRSGVTTRLFSSYSPSALLPLDIYAQREVDSFQEWAASCGVQAENGFGIMGQLLIDGNYEDYYAATFEGASQGSRVLYVPAEMILSAAWIEQEYQGCFDASFQLLASENMAHLRQQYILFIKLLVEYEQGDASPYMPWLQAMPRQWNTAVSMDNFCATCLPPFIKSLCVEEREQLAVFRKALREFDYVSEESKVNYDLLKFAYNVVQTRSWETPDGDRKIVPMADFINHDYPDNVEISYDEYGGCQVYTTEDVPPGGALTLNYGQPMNPSRFLATYGFLKEETPAVFCKMIFNNPSQELLDIGYDPNRMLFDTSDGSVAQEVWDVVLYSRIERKKDLAHIKDAFYQAHMSGDEDTKAAIHAEFQSDTVKALLRHVNHILVEVSELMVKMNSYDSSKHPRLPLLLRHHQLVDSTFTKVRDYLMALQE